MYIKLILLITFAIINAQDEYGSSRIEEDAEKWAQMYMKYIQRSPSGTVRAYNTQSCQIVRECCPEKRADLYKIINDNKLAENCINTKITGSFNSHTPNCKRLIKSWYDLGQTSVYKQFIDATRRSPASTERAGERKTLMGRVCSKRELEAYYCEPEDRTPLQSCAAKVLRLIHREQGADGYDTFVRDFKYDFNSYYKAVSTAFP